MSVIAEVEKIPIYIGGRCLEGGGGQSVGIARSSS